MAIAHGRIWSGTNRFHKQVKTKQEDWTMTIPNESHPGWLKAISGQGNLEFECLATKVIMGRLNQDYRRDPSPGAAKKCAVELRNFFQKNLNLPKVQADLKKIVEGR
jgi:hypothetical protein